MSFYAPRRMSYQAYLAGAADEVIAAEVAAAASNAGALRAIGVGVATGVLTLLINRWLERMLR